MPRKRKHSGPVRHLNIPQMDEDQYFELWDILNGSIFMGNRSALARLLGLSVPTIAAMRERTPGKGKQWWWNIVLRSVVVRLYEQLRDSSHKSDREKARGVLGALDRAGVRGEEVLQELQWRDNRANGCARYLLALVANQPSSAIKIKKLQKPGLANGYTLRTFRDAAERLCLVKEKREDGWYYRLPDMDDCD